VVFWFIVAVHLGVAIEYVRDWPIARGIAEAFVHGGSRPGNP
jgi:hypothetical protein